MWCESISKIYQKYYTFSIFALVFVRSTFNKRQELVELFLLIMYGDLCACRNFVLMAKKSQQKHSYKKFYFFVSHNKWFYSHSLVYHSCLWFWDSIPMAFGNSGKCLCARCGRRKCRVSGDFKRYRIKMFFILDFFFCQHCELKSLM